MKHLEPNVYHEITDPETGSITLQLDLTSKAIEYSPEEFKIWVENDAIPSDLVQFHLEELKRSKEELERWNNFIKENPNATDEQKIENWSKRIKIPTKEELEKRIALFDFLCANHEKLKLVLDSSANPKTFAIPSHTLMFSLLAMFAGKPKKIPRELLEKPCNERTREEQEQAEKYLSEIFETKKEFDFSEGTEKISETRIAIICNNAKVECKADISWNLFRHDHSFREERLALYIKRTFGPEGIRHLLALIIGLEENFRKGHFEWSVNEHLERLGYRKKANGSYDNDLKRMASEIVKIFTGLCITSTRKDGKNGSIKAKFLFMTEGYELQTFEKEIIDQRITLVATDFWYKNAFSATDGQAPQYTKLLKEIVKENHREHPLTLYLTPLFAIFWRINPERKFKVRTLMDWCDLKTEGKYKSERLHDLETTLEYMKNKNYIGGWTNSDETARFPSKCLNPYECVLTFTPPDWLKQEFVNLEHNREITSPPHKQKMITQPEFLKIVEESGLTRKQLANSLGITPQLITAIINGKRKVTEKTSKKILQFKGDRLETRETKSTPLSGVD
jgi:hypothetical protein